LAEKRKTTKPSAKLEEESLMAALAPYAPVLGVSAGMGFLVALAAKSALKVSAVIVGLAAVLAPSLQSMGFITIHWDRIQNRILSTLDFNKDGELTSDDLRSCLMTGGTAFIFQAGLPGAVGFFAGFFFGLIVA
jgi:FUN14 domain-containing protein 1